MLRLLLLSALLVSLAACGNDISTPRDAASSEDLAESIGNTVEDALSDAFSESERALEDRPEPVAEETLSNLLPERLAGLRRTERSSVRQGALGFYVAVAEGQYRGDDGAALEVNLVDIGGVASPSGMGYSWANTRVDRESEHTYERTLTYAGYTAHEEYNRRTRSGSFALIVGNRFVVEVEGENVSPEMLRAAIDGLDLTTLKELQEAAQ